MPDFETIYPASDCEMIRDAYDAVTKTEMWEWLASYTPDEGKGFMFSDHPNLRKINAQMEFDGHSGASYGWCMRLMESIAKGGGWERFRERILKARADAASRNPPCPCRAADGHSTGWCGVAGGGVPACDH